MIYAGSIIAIKEENFEKVKHILSAFPQVQVHTQSDDKCRLVVSIEEESSRTLEALCDQLKEKEEIIEISHTNFFFGDEVEKMEMAAG
ncbi:MAG: chaperone NapD [bacterium]|nr:chaperone NapD [bacterium]